MARTLSHKLVSSKIDILAEQRNYLQTFVDETNEVLQLATSWLRNEEDITNSFKYTDINMMMDDKLAFLLSAGFSAKLAGEQESVATRSFPPASKSTDQPFPPASKSTDQPLPGGPGHVSGVSVPSDEIKTIMNQVKVMQDYMSFLSTSSEKLAEKQLAMEMLVESLPDKYSKIEQNKIKEIEIELKSICEKQKKVAKQQDKRMTSFEKKIQAVTDSQSDIIENCHQQQSKIKDYNKENERLQTQSQQMTQDLSDVLENMQELNSRISVLENQAITNTQLEALVNRVELIEASSEDLSAKFEEHGSSFEEFTRRTEETLKDLPSVRGIEFEQLQKFEEKISALEKSWCETSQGNKKLYQDVETKYEMMCQVIADRLLPLERLRDIFNDKLDVRTEHLKKLDIVCDEMAVLLPKISQIETWTQRQAIGFSAQITSELSQDIERGDVIFSCIISNFGNHYDPTTGQFTAPLDGLYAASLSVTINKSGALTLNIVKVPSISSSIHELCYLSTLILSDVNNKGSTFVLTEMKKGDKLFVWCKYVNDDTCIFSSSIFSCFKIK